MRNRVLQFLDLSSDRSAVLGGGVAPIAGQIKELQNSIAHLLRSNKEMEEIIAESGPDKELRDAIGENIVVIARRKAILADLLKLLAETEQPAAATAAPPLTADGSTADAGVYL